MVVPLTTSAGQAGRGPTPVEIPGGVAGLAKPSCAICHQATTLDRGKLKSRAGALPPRLLLEVDEALRSALDLE